MFVLTLFFLLSVSSYSRAYSEEPQCSKFHYELKTLELVVRFEHRMNIFEKQMDEWKKTLDGWKEMDETRGEEIQKLRLDATEWTASVTEQVGNLTEHVANVVLQLTEQDKERQRQVHRLQRDTEQLKTNNSENKEQDTTTTAVSLDELQTRLENEMKNMTDQLEERILAKVNKTWTHLQEHMSPETMAALIKVGTKVVRGRDWEWSNQDGTPPGIGTVISAVTSAGWVRVKWGTGILIYSYRMGAEGKYDLAIV